MDTIMFTAREPHHHSNTSHWTNGTNGMNGTHLSQASSSKHHQNGQNMLVAWIVLQLAGQVTLPILVATLLFHKRIARRNPTIINLCIVWTLATIPPEILFYTGEYKPGGPEPSTLLCLFQAATISGVPPMAATAYLAVVIHACTVIYEVINSNTPKPFALDLRMIILLSSPYISFFVFSFFMAVLGTQNPKDVHRDLFFCEIINHGVSIPVFSFTFIIVIFTLISQIWIAIMFYRHYYVKRKQKRRGDHESRNLRRDIHPIEIQLLIRMVAFTIFEIVIVVSSITSILSPHMGASKLLFATPPFAVFLIFSSSRDIYAAWFPCCLQRKSSRQLNVSRQEYDTRDRSFLARESMGPSSPPPSEISRYSQRSLPPPPPAIITTVTTVSDMDPRDMDLDLEEGPVPAMRATHPTQSWKDNRLNQPQEHRTIMVVHHQSSSSSSPDSVLDAIRTLRAPEGARSKARLSY